MAEVSRVDVGNSTFDQIYHSGKLVIGKPPWSEVHHTGKVERLILHIGSGKGKFSEVYGIPRSIGCIGNNRFILRRQKLSLEEIRNVLKDFKSIGGEVWITNYDSVEELNSVVGMAVELGIKDVKAVVLFEDLSSVEPIDGVSFIAEVDYDPDKIISAAMKLWVKGLLITVNPSEVKEVKDFISRVIGDSDLDVFIDVLYPKSARYLTFNTIEVRKIQNVTTTKYHDCLAGTLSVTADGYVTPCPLLRSFVIGDLREKGLKKIVGRSKKLREFWTLTKDQIEGCSTCPFRYICHDCRALEYQATGSLTGMEYCPIFLSELKN